MRLAILWLALPSVLALNCPSRSHEIPGYDVCITTEFTADTYDANLKKCRSAGGDLMKITDRTLNVYTVHFAQPALGGKKAYIGVQKIPKGNWTYSDGTPLTYSNWEQGEPNNAYSCAFIDLQTMKWSSVDCNVKLPYIYEVPEKSSPCNVRWNYGKEANSCYFVQDFTLVNNKWLLYNFTYAEDLCKEKKAHLVSIHSPEEDAIVKDLVKSVGVYRSDECDNYPYCCWVGQAYIGLLRSLNGTYTWTDNTPVDYMDKTYYLSGFVNRYSILNDSTCKVKNWDPYAINSRTARFVCKMAARNTAE